MNNTSVDLKAELMTQAEVLIDELVEWTADTPAATLTQIEDIVLKLRQRLGERMAVAVIEAQAAIRPGPDLVTLPVGARCTTRTARPTRSRAGWAAWPWSAVTTTVRPVKAGFFHLDQQLAVWDGHWSEQIAKHCVWLSALVEFEDAAEIFDRIGHLSVSTSSVWRRAKVWGARGQAVETAQRAVATALPPRAEIVAGEARQSRDLGVALDGALVHIRQEGLKELKVGCVFEIEVKPTRDRHTGDWIDLAHAIHNSYVAHLSGPEVFGQSVWAEARRRDWTQARETVAPWTTARRGSGP